MSTPLVQYDLPESYIRKFQPVRVSSRDKGLPAYLFDSYGLQFFRKSATADQVPCDAVWSIICQGPSMLLRAGEYAEALGFIISQRPCGPSDQADVLLLRRLSYRQRLQRSILESLIKDLATAPCQVPDALFDFLRQRLATSS